MKHGPDKFLPQTVSAFLSPTVLPLVHEPNLLSVEQWSLPAQLSVLMKFEVHSFIQFYETLKLRKKVLQ